MGTRNFLLNLAKKYVTVGLIGLTISDRYVSIVPVRGHSMTPTFNPQFGSSFADDRVLIEKLCLERYKFSHGDVVVFSSPSDHREKHVKRITGLPGDWVNTDLYDAVVIPEGHCWVTGDNPASSLDSRSYGPIPLGLIRGRVTHIVWPPQRFAKLDKQIVQNNLPI
ncbi:protease [Lithospermum erythrorhizon]|uniref:Mitochondrial inner membrane protease subunit 2 n=1 Tax=Lithospermum erythrorhizon TaxID=34254 RepID=A0AAV3PUJ1_LITER